MDMHAGAVNGTTDSEDSTERGGSIASDGGGGGIIEVIMCRICHEGSDQGKRERERERERGKRCI